jgi:hypothetical protein
MSPFVGRLADPRTSSHLPVPDGEGALLRRGSRRGYATPGFFVSRRTCSDDVADRDAVEALCRCGVGTAITITDEVAWEAKLLGKPSEHGMRAWYVMLRMKKLFKIKAKMFYIDRSHISKRARGIVVGGFQNTQRTPERTPTGASRGRHGRLRRQPHPRSFQRYVMKKRFTSSGTSTTKNETSTRKLTLSRETLRYLSAPELARVEGGNKTADDDTWETCPPSCVETKG